MPATARLRSAGPPAPAVAAPALKGDGARADGYGVRLATLTVRGSTAAPRAGRGVAS